MKTATAIRTLLGNGVGCNPEMVYPKASMMEIKEFKESCSPEEWIDFGRQACEVLGEIHEI